MPTLRAEEAIRTYTGGKESITAVWTIHIRVGYPTLTAQSIVCDLPGTIGSTLFTVDLGKLATIFAKELTIFIVFIVCYIISAVLANAARKTSLSATMNCLHRRKRVSAYFAIAKLSSMIFLVAVLAITVPCDDYDIGRTTAFRAVLRIWFKTICTQFTLRV